MPSLIVRRRKLGRTSCREIGKAAGIPVTRLDPQQILEVPDGTTVIRWGCLQTIKGAGVEVNTPDMIKWAGDKLSSRVELARMGIAPKTVTNWLEYKQLAFPIVGRPRYHAQGKNMWVMHNEAELMAQFTNGPLSSIPHLSYYLSEFRPKAREFRVMFAQGHIVWVAEKFPEDPKAYAWNVAQGGRFENVRWSAWPLDVLKVALYAAWTSQMHFGAVDIIVDTAGLSWALEINSAPSHTTPYRQQCLAKVFAFIAQNGLALSPADMHSQDWKKLIHPAIL